MSRRRRQQEHSAPLLGAHPASQDEIRIGPALPIPGLLREFGVEPAGVLAAAGLVETQFADAENRISFHVAAQLLEASITATSCEHFGLLIGERFSPATVGVNFYLMRNAPTLREALRSFELHAHLHERGAVPYLIETDLQDAALAYGIYHDSGFEMAPFYDAAIAIAMALLRSICGPGWRPTRVTFPHSRPKNVAPYLRYFGVPPEFDSVHAAVYFSARWLDEPIKGRDPILHAALVQLIKEREEAAAQPLPDKVRRALRTMVVAGNASADRLAALFGLHRRSLHRRLHAEGTNLQTLVNEARCEVSCQLLSESDMTIGEIAKLLNYSDATAFSRAFSGWTGKSPREWRSSKNRRRTSTGRPRSPA